MNLSVVAQAFSGSALTSSYYKRLQRFLRGFTPDLDQCAQVIAQLFCPSGRWVLCMDRTNWNFDAFKINFLVLSVAHEGVGIPLLWILLPKKGNSNTAERQQILDRFVRLFGVEKIQYFTADREFRGKQWLKYLAHMKIPFCLRIPNNTLTQNKHKTKTLRVSRLFGLKAGESMTLNSSRRIWGTTVYLACLSGAKGRVIVATNHPSPSAIAHYAVRWAIETLFGCLKSRGFDLEKTHLKDTERLSTLLLVVSLAFCFCFKVGIWQHQKTPIKIKKHGRKAKSIFRLGLDRLQRILLNFHAKNQDFNIMLRVLSCT